MWSARLGEFAIHARTSGMRKVVYAVAGVLLVANVLAVLLPPTPLGKSTAAAWVQWAFLVSAFAGALVGAASSRHGERPLFVVITVSTGSFLIATSIKVYFLMVHHRLTVSPSPDDVWLYLGLLTILATCVIFGRSVRGGGLSALGRIIDYASMTVCVFSLIFTFLLRPLGITGPGVSGMRTAIMIGYSSLPVSCALYPLVFRRVRLKGWAVLLQTALVLCGLYAMIGLTVVGVGWYYLGSPALAASDALMSMMLFCLGAAGIWRATEPGDMPGPEDRGAPETWPAFVMLTLALVGIPTGIYATLRWDDELSSLISGGLTSLLVLLVVARAVVMRLELSRLTERDEILQRYRALVESSPAAVFVLSEKRDILFANPAAAVMFDAPSPADLIGVSMADFTEEPAVPDGEPGSFESLIRRQAQNLTSPPPFSPPARITMRTLTGRRLVAERTLAVIPYRGKTAILAQGSDVTCRSDAEHAAEEYQDRLRSLAAELMLAEARERRTLAETLQAHLGSLLTAARARIRAAEMKGYAEGGDIEVSVSMVEDAIEITRTLTTELTPQSLYREGLAAALTDLAFEISSSHNVSCTLDGRIDEGHLPDGILAMLYRSARELVVNSVKHSGSPSIEMHLSTDGPNVRLSVVDVGHGFSVDSLSTTRSSSFGLFSVRESVRAARGTLDIASSANTGTRVDICVPIPEETSP